MAGDSDHHDLLAADGRQGSHHLASSHHGSQQLHAQPGAAHEPEPTMSPGWAILILYGTMFLMVGAQTALFMWKKKHKKSYELVTLMGLWLMPAIFSMQLHFWRFLVVWLAYTTVTCYLLSQCTKRKMESTTPRKVYGWFLGVYRTSVAAGVAGYILLLLEVFGMGPLLRLFLSKDFTLDLLWYGVYFGVLGRDCAEVASDRMAAMMGTGRALVSRVNNCGICGQELQDNFSQVEVTAVAVEGERESDIGSSEKVVQLSCKHCFHEQCVRGWVMVGKKDTCPVCMEKVDLRALYADRPWETRNLTWIQMLDGVRYLVVWNPLIFCILSLMYHVILPHHGHGAHGDGDHGLHAAAGINGTSVHPVALALAAGNGTLGHPITPAVAS